ncbi:MAG: 4-hydroxy-tetrahydrodipicolinate reductase [Parachlamydiaceae bacterium]|nr:4-hydroxy-tetrahydrodipicolinate reductase [Parachlamydiaceae bacterium]
MKIALIGYGKMGKMVEMAAKSKGYSITAIIDPHLENNIITKDSVNTADVCIDFTNPSSALDNIKALASLGKNIVMGTTGWYNDIDGVKRIVEQANIGFLYSPNFSIGVALFLEIVSQAAALISPFDAYDVGGYEIHHSQKADFPSGTAKAISQRLLSNIPRKKEVIYQINHKILPDQIHFTCLRNGSTPGTHSVSFDSPADTITLTHTARSREGFALGAIQAAEWLNGKKGFFTLDDMLL